MIFSPAVAIACIGFVFYVLLDQYNHGGSMFNSASRDFELADNARTA